MTWLIDTTVKNYFEELLGDALYSSCNKLYFCTLMDDKKGIQFCLRVAGSDGRVLWEKRYADYQMFMTRKHAATISLLMNHRGDVVKAV